jgi:hypothetical protein
MNVVMIDLATVALITPVLFTLTGIGLLVTLWKGSKVVQLDHQDVERLFDLHVDKRWNGIERRNGVDRRSGIDRRSGTDRRQSKK